MKQKLLLFSLAACVAVTFAACQKATAPDEVIMEGSEQIVSNMDIMPDYYGVYEGLLPAADGPGIQTTLTLNQNGAFTLTSAYVDRDFTATDKGDFTVKGDLLTLTDQDGEMTYYQIQEGALRRLNMDKRPVTGPLADHYVLTQTLAFH